MKEQLIRSIFEKQVELCNDNLVYKKDIDEIGGKISINWDFSGMQAYQVYRTDGCEGGVNEQIEEADLFIEFYEEDKCIEFLVNEEVTQYHIMPGTLGLDRGYYEFGYFLDSFAKGPDGNMHREAVPAFKVTLREGLEFSFLYLTRMPIFKPAFNEYFDPLKDDPKDIGIYIPINESLFGGKLATEIFYHFIDKTESIFRLPNCPCRKAYGSKYRVDLGCIHFGEDTLKMPHPETRGTYIDRDEAKEVLSLAIEDGLIPLLGRVAFEAIGFGIEEEGRLLSTCYCGGDSCFNSTICRKASNGASYIFKRVPGLSLHVDRDKCIACGKCMKTCPYRGMEWVDGKPEIIDRCFGCGQCESACPVGAISFELEYDFDTMVQKAIEAIDNAVDVTKIEG